MVINNVKPDKTIVKYETEARQAGQARQARHTREAI